MREIRPEELSTRQKLGFVTNMFVTGREDELEYVLEHIRNHSVGSVWVNPTIERHAEVMARIKEAADYPLLIFCDAESGIDGHFVGKHNSIGMTGSEELAYMFGKVTAVTARNMGYNVVCDPVVDMVNGNWTCGGNVRSLGNDKHQVARLACAEARGMHDGGILTVAKHYPGAASSGRYVDSHMGETTSDETEEELLAYNLHPYLELMKDGLLDGIMTKHTRFVNIDPDYPASLSRKVIDIIRRQGFDGFCVTDALCMMGVVAKFGKKNSIGLAVANGNDIALAYTGDNRFAYECMCRCYDEGMIDDARLDEAVRRILATQHKTLAAPKYTALTEEDLADFARINRDSVYARTDEGIPTALSRGGRHYFAILTETALDLNNRDKIAVDTLQKGWYNPLNIADKIRENFPNSAVQTISQFPSASENMRILEQSLGFDDVVFVTFFNSQAYIGTECLTSRIISLMNAMQVSGRISTVVHFGNPYVLEELPHIPRVVIGTTSSENVLHTFNVLAGDYPANGVLTYDIHLK